MMKIVVLLGCLLSLALALPVSVKSLSTTLLLFTAVVQQTLLSKDTYTEQIHVKEGAVGVRAPCSIISWGKVMYIGDRTQNLLVEGATSKHLFGEVIKPIFSQGDEVHERMAHSSQGSNFRRVCSVHQM